MQSPRNILITGANTGIGLATVEVLADQGHSIWIAGRSEQKTRPVIETLRARAAKPRVEFLPLDLGDLASVRACAERVLALPDPIHVLIANAGLAGQRGLTKDGFELAFGTNHLGHFLLTTLLLPAIERAGTADRHARIVVVASKAHYRALRLDFAALRQPTKTYTGYPEYAVSKLCNVLFAAELSRRLAGKPIDTYSLHPGVVASDIWRRVPWPFRSLVKLGMITNEEGAKTSLFCALSPEAEGKTGRYWKRCAESKPSSLARDESLAKELWAKSEDFVRG